MRRLIRWSEHAILLLLAFSVLWRGGKSLESTWLLTGVACMCVLAKSWQVIIGKRIAMSSTFTDVLCSTVMLFMLWMGLSYLTSTTQNYGLDEVVRTGGLGLIFLWYLQRTVHDEPEQQIPDRYNSSEGRRNTAFEQRFLTWLSRLTLIACVIGVFVYIFQPVDRFVGTFFDMRFHTDYWPNAFAEFLLLTWPIVLFATQSRQWVPMDDQQPEAGKGIHRLPLTAFRLLLPLHRLLLPLRRHLLLGFILGSLLLTYSRGALLAFFGQIIMLFVLLFLQQGEGKRVRFSLRYIAAALLIALGTFVVTNDLRSRLHPVQKLEEKIAFTAPEGRSSIDERISFWKQALLLTRDKPILGWGPYSFRFIQPRLQKSVLATSDHPHNVFLKIGMEDGLPAAFLFACLLIAALLRGMHLALTGKRLDQVLDHDRSGYALLTVSLAGIAAHNLIDYNLQFVGIALPFWLVMGIILRSKEQEVRSKDKQLGHLRTPYSLLLTTLLSFALLVISIREGYFLITSSLGRHAEARGNVETALRWYGQSEKEWFTRDLLMSEALLYRESGKTMLAEQVIHAYLDKNAQDARAWKFLGELLRAKASTPEAIEAYEKAFHLGGWNDLGISRGLLEVLLAETYAQPTSAAAAESSRLPLHSRIPDVVPEIEERVIAFAQAIEKNLHYTALSPNPEEAVKILVMLEVLHPDLAQKYRVLIRQIEENTAKERARIRARGPGWLW